MATRSPPLSHNDYTMACICPMGVELAAVEGMLDEIQRSLPSSRDQNAYTLGQIGQHNIVVAVMPAIGTNRAASVAMQLLNDFQSIRFVLLVGIGGAAPGQEEDDVRLGDVVVSKPTAIFGGVVQYDMGKITQGGVLQRTGFLKPPPPVLTANVQRLQAQHFRIKSQIPKYLTAMLAKYPNMRKKQYVYQGEENDQLFQAMYDHEGGPTCQKCDQSNVLRRLPRSNNDPEVHYGTIGSGNSVIKDGATRERLRKELGVLCVEMEAAGLMEDFSCLVIRGICDYADSHKNKRWQPYAAATAAAYMKELLHLIPPQEIAQASKVVEALPESTVFSVPFPRDKQFIDRKHIFSSIETGHHAGRPVALCGIGGIGKSQIAIEYAHRFRDQHPHGHVLWVYAANETRFVQAYRDAADKAKLPGREDPQANVCQLLREWLNDMADVPWLVILDNADDSANFLPPSTEVGAERPAHSGFVAGYLPQRFCKSQYLLITTRNREVGEYLSQGQACVDVDPLSSQEAADLLRTRLQVLHPPPAVELNKLVKTLGRIPLAITQAAAFINRNKSSVAEYVEELATNRDNFMAYLSKDLQDPRREAGFPNSVFRTWKLSFDQIQALDPRAAEALSLMAMLDGQKISEDLIRKEDERRIDFRNAIGTLHVYSMITIDTEGKMYTMHPLVQLSVQYVMEQSRQTLFYAEHALELISDTFPFGRYENKDICESLLPHAQAVLQHHVKSDKAAEDRALLMYNVGSFELKSVRYESAYQHLQSAYRIYQEMYGDEHMDTVNSVTQLARLLKEQGKFDEAEEMGRQVLPRAEELLGVEHDVTLSILNDLALVLVDQEKHGEAEEMQLRVLTGYEKKHGASHPWTLCSRNNLALILQHQEKYEEAEKMHREVLTRQEKVTGPTHPDTLTTLSNLADCFLGQGKSKEAEEMFRRALTERENVLVANHPEILNSLHLLAHLLRGQKKYEEAEKLYRQSLEGREQVLGMRHPDTLSTVWHIASLYDRQNRFEQASTFYQRALSGYRETLGSEHADTKRCSRQYELLLDKMETERREQENGGAERQLHKPRRRSARISGLSDPMKGPEKKRARKR